MLGETVSALRTASAQETSGGTEQYKAVTPATIYQRYFPVGQLSHYQSPKPIIETTNNGLVQPITEVPINVSSVINVTLHVLGVRVAGGSQGYAGTVNARFMISAGGVVSLMAASTSDIQTSGVVVNNYDLTTDGSHIGINFSIAGTSLQNKVLLEYSVMVLE